MSTPDLLVVVVTSRGGDQFSLEVFSAHIIRIPWQYELAAPHLNQATQRYSLTEGVCQSSGVSLIIDPPLLDTPDSDNKTLLPIS